MALLMGAGNSLWVILEQAMPSILISACSLQLDLSVTAPLELQDIVC
jgi:hypothetical protein